MTRFLNDLKHFLFFSAFRFFWSSLTFRSLLGNIWLYLDFSFFVSTRHFLIKNNIGPITAILFYISIVHFEIFKKNILEIFLLNYKWVGEIFSKTSIYISSIFLCSQNCSIQTRLVILDEVNLTIVVLARCDILPLSQHLLRRTEA